MTDASAGPSRVSILIADDHGVLRAGLRALLNAESDMEVVGEAADGNTAFSAAISLRPDVVLADISMPGRSGIDLARDLKALMPGVRVLILTMHEDRGLFDEAMNAGAAGYVVKRAVESDLTAAIRAVACGATYVHLDGQSASPEESVDFGPSVAEPRQDVLADGELEVLRLLARGYPQQKVAEALGLEVSAVETLRMSLAGKGLRSRVDMIKYARKRDLL
jgi:two-component system, NarL family, response regulator NreC